MTTFSQKDPVAEAVKNMIPPDQSGIVYVAKRYIVEAMASGNANATSTGDSIIDGLDLNATGVADRHDDAGSNGGEALKWEKNGGTNDYITGKILVQNAASLAGTVIIEYVPLS
jgi:hypothetical protein